MRRIKILLTFLKLAVAEKLGFMNNVLFNIETNKELTIAPDALEDGKAAVKALDDANQKAIAGGKKEGAILHDVESLADEVFRRIVGLIEAIAKGNETIMILAGFNVSKQPDIFHKPVLAVKKGLIKGSVLIVAEAVDKAGAYKYQMAVEKEPEDEAGWISIGYSTISKHSVSGLKPGTECFFRVAPITRNGLLDYCAPVSKIID